MPTVIFVTQDFGVIENGPGIFARYLWDYFERDSEIAFYVFCASSTFKHRKIVSLDLPKSKSIFDSSSRYRAVTKSAEDFALTRNGKVIIHFNSAFTNFLRTEIRKDIFTIGQVNDYEAAQAFKFFFGNVKDYGLRRAVSLMFRHFQEKDAVRRQDLTIANSCFTKAKICQHYSSISRDIEVIYKSVDYAFFHGGQRVESLELRIAFVGNDWRRKGLIDLLRAVSFVSLPLRVLIAGTPPSALSEIEGLIESLGLRHQVVIYGSVSRDELKDILYSADIFVLPSHGEALGVSIIEGLATGIPAICYRVGGIPEIIRNDFNGLLVEEDDIAGLAKCISYLGAHPEVRRAMGRRAQMDVERFSKTYMLRRYRELYSSF